MIRYYKPQKNMMFKEILKNVKDNNGVLHLVKIETTGLNPDIDEICGIRVVKLNVDNEVKAKSIFKAIVHTDIPISREASRVSGITQRMVQNGISPDKMLRSLNEYLGDNAYICGFNTKGFIYPFLFKCARKSDINIRARGGFDIMNLARTCILPDIGSYTSGYSAKDMCDLFKVKNDVAGYVNILNELYKRLSFTQEKVYDGFIEGFNYIKRGNNRYIVFKTKIGRIILNCDTLYFEDYEAQFDKINMDSFVSYVMKKTNASSVYEITKKLRTIV